MRLQLGFTGHKVRAVLRKTTCYPLSSTGIQPRQGALSHAAVTKDFAPLRLRPGSAVLDSWSTNWVCFVVSWLKYEYAMRMAGLRHAMHNGF